jgi:hypothetical protein
LLLRASPKENYYSKKATKQTDPPNWGISVSIFIQPTKEQSENCEIAKKPFIYASRVLSLAFILLYEFGAGHFCVQLHLFGLVHTAFFHGCNGGGSKLGTVGGSSGSKYQSARYNKTPGNAALKSVPKTQTTRNFEDGRSKCFASPPQTPASWRSSRERQSFIIFRLSEGRVTRAPILVFLNSGLAKLVPPNIGERGAS